MTESPSIAMAKVGPRGALPKTPFLLYSLPVMNLMNTTYLSHAQTIYYSFGKNFIEKMVDLGPWPKATKQFFWMSYTAI